MIIDKVMLRDTEQKLEVKKSSWGLGTFLVEVAKAGDLLAGIHSR